MSFSPHKVRYALIGLLVTAGFALAPSAFARGHLNVGVNIGLPGISFGYSDYGRRGGYAYGGFYPAYAPVYYGPSYYPPTYYGPVYGPAYYSGYPAYGVVYSAGYPSARGYYRGPSRAYYGGGRDHRGASHRGNYGQRAQYYDRGGRR